MAAIDKVVQEFINKLDVDYGDIVSEWLDSGYKLSCGNIPDEYEEDWIWNRKCDKAILLLEKDSFIEYFDVIRIDDWYNNFEACNRFNKYLIDKIENMYII